MSFLLVLAVDAAAVNCTYYSEYQTCTDVLECTWQLGTCVVAVANCASYYPDGYCVYCISGFVLAEQICMSASRDVPVAECYGYERVPCEFTYGCIWAVYACVAEVANCAVHMSSGGCMECLPHFALYEQSCVSCPANCVNCTNDAENPQICNSDGCEPGFAFYESACAYCPENCDSCTKTAENAPKCAQNSCAAGFVLAEATGSCVAETANCAAYAASSGACVDCVSGFVLNAGACAACPENCINCTIDAENALRCAQDGCEPGFVFLESIGACARKITRCSAYNADKTCAACYIGFEATESGVSCGQIAAARSAAECLNYAVDECVSVGNCAVFGAICVLKVQNCAAYDISGACVSCSAGYAFDGAECQACPENCNSCYKYDVGATRCFPDACEQNYAFQPNTGFCVPNMANCAHQYAGKCVSCETGYYLKADYSGCEMCMEGCEICADELTCEVCYKGYNYAFNECDLVCEIGTIKRNYMCVSCGPFASECYLFGKNQTAVPKTCINGYYLETPSYTCTKCKFPCKICTNANTCTDCVAGYTHFAAKNACLPCTRCSQCNFHTNMTFKSCNFADYADTDCPDGWKYTKEPLANDYTGTSLPACYEKCNQTSYYDADGRCHACPLSLANCAQCASATACYYCEPGYKLYSGSGAGANKLCVREAFLSRTLSAALAKTVLLYNKSPVLALAAAVAAAVLVFGLIAAATALALAAKRRAAVSTATSLAAVSEAPNGAAQAETLCTE